MADSTSRSPADAPAGGDRPNDNGPSHHRPTSAARRSRSQEDESPRALEEPFSEETEGEGTSSLLYSRLTAFETALTAGGLLLFLALLYKMWDFLNPPLLGIAGILLLWPLRKHRTVRALMISGGVLLLIWFLADLSAILIPFIAAYLLAYLLDPAVDYLQGRFGTSRWILSLLISVAVVGLVTLFFVLLVPRLIGQVEVLAQRSLEGLNNLRHWVATTPLLTKLESEGIIDRQQLAGQIDSMLQAQTTSLTGNMQALIQGLLRSLDSLLAVLTFVTIMPVVLFYTIKDYRPITRRLLGLFPTHGGQRDYLLRASNIVGDYLRGQLIICAIAAFNVSVVLLIFGVPLWLLIGLIAGLANLIPNLGAVLTMIVAVSITVILGDPWLIDTVVVIAALLGQGLLEQSILTPKIMSHQVGLHPVLIILSLFVFGYFLGIFGLLIAVPTTALMMTAYKAYRKTLTLDLSSYHEPASRPKAQQRSPSD